MPLLKPPEGLKSAVVLLRPDESLPLWFASRDGKLRLASMSSDFHSIGAGIQVCS